MIGQVLRREIEATFTVIKDRSTPEEIVFVCPEPACGDKSGNRSVNLRNGKTNCWRCEKGGDFLRWAKRLGYQFSTDAESSHAIPVGKLLEAKPETREFSLPSVKAVKLPYGFTSLSDEPDSRYAKRIAALAERKRLGLEDFIEVGAGFTRQDALWQPFCIFPVWEGQTVVYYQGRSWYDEPDLPTKKFPSRREVEFGARYWLYNLDEVEHFKTPTVLVVESILNVLSLRRKIRQEGLKREVGVVAAFKHAVSAEQAYKIVRLSYVSEVCLLFDADATAAAWRQAVRFRAGRSLNLTLAEMPVALGNPTLDPNDDVDLAWECFEARQEFKPGSALSRRAEDPHLDFGTHLVPRPTKYNPVL